MIAPCALKVEIGCFPHPTPPSPCHIPSLAPLKIEFGCLSLSRPPSASHSPSLAVLVSRPHPSLFVSLPPSRFLSSSSFLCHTHTQTQIHQRIHSTGDIQHCCLSPLPFSLLSRCLILTLSLFVSLPCTHTPPAHSYCGRFPL